MTNKLKPKWECPKDGFTANHTPIYLEEPFATLANEMLTVKPNEPEKFPRLEDIANINIENYRRG